MSTRTRPPTLAAALVPLLVGGLTVGTLVAPPAFADPAAAPSVDAAAAGPIETSRGTDRLAPGVTHDSFDRWQSDGWLRADALTVDLTSGAKVEYLSADPVASTQPISTQVKAIPNAVAAVNGDFFDINDTGASNGVGISDGELVKSANDGRANAVSLDPQGLGRILQIDFDGTVTTPAGTVLDLAALNANTLDAGEIGEYTPLWGAMSRTRVVVGAARTAEVVVTDGVVSSVGATPGEGAIPQGSVVLVGREAGADALLALKVGDALGIEYAPKTSDGSVSRTAIGGNQLLVVDGVVQTHPDDGQAARSAVGFSADGATMYVLTVDGKQTNSAGITVPQMAAMMAELGAHNAINIDGGGSSTMLAREPGTDELGIVNSPSDGSERPVANGLAITVPEGTGKLDGYTVDTAADPARAPGAAPVAGGSPDRVFPGLSRQLTAVGHDEQYGPAKGRPRWSTDDRGVGYVDAEGVFHARRTGETTVTARSGRDTGCLDLAVLGELTRLDGTVERVGLA
ncbi:MAG TPA: phosphodiester glycosidase family protein, partial [Phytomonospora sp.]